jgi:hypothetical protein
MARRNATPSVPTSKIGRQAYVSYIEAILGLMYLDQLPEVPSPGKAVAHNSARRRTRTARRLRLRIRP